MAGGGIHRGDSAPGAKACDKCCWRVLAGPWDQDRVEKRYAGNGAADVGGAVSVVRERRIQ